MGDPQDYERIIREALPKGDVEGEFQQRVLGITEAITQLLQHQTYTGAVPLVFTTEPMLTKLNLRLDSAADEKLAEIEYAALLSVFRQYDSVASLRDRAEALEWGPEYDDFRDHLQRYAASLETLVSKYSETYRKKEKFNLRREYEKTVTSYESKKTFRISRYGIIASEEKDGLRVPKISQGSLRVEVAIGWQPHGVPARLGASAEGRVTFFDFDDKKLSSVDFKAQDLDGSYVFVSDKIEIPPSARRFTVEARGMQTGRTRNDSFSVTGNLFVNTSFAGVAKKTASLQYFEHYEDGHEEDYTPDINMNLRGNLDLLDLI